MFLVLAHRITQISSSHFLKTRGTSVHTYYAASEYSASIIKKSKYHNINNVIPVGQHRSDYISLYKKEITPKEMNIETCLFGMARAWVKF